MSRVREEGKQKSTHQKLQAFLKTLYPDGQIEYSFSSIGRRCDFFVERLSLVYEIQFSPISDKEIESRNLDYAALGLSVIWLIQPRFEKRKQQRLFERVKAQYYFFNELSVSFLFYDRLCLLPYTFLRPREFDLSRHCLVKDELLPSTLPYCLRKKIAFRYYFKGDYLDYALHSPALMELLHSKENRLKNILYRFKAIYTLCFKKLLRSFCV